MELSKMFGVDRDTVFCVEMFEGKFRIMSSSGRERLYFKSEGGDWGAVTAAWMLYGVIESAPSGIIHLPPPLTDEQREQLKALWTLGYRWIAKDHDDKAFAYGTIRPLKAGPIWLSDGHGYLRISKELPVFVVASLVNLSDPEPYDIGKALGVEG